MDKAMEDALVEVAIADAAESAPGRKLEALHEATADLPLDIQGYDEGRERTTIWSTVDGTPSEVLNNANSLGRALKKRYTNPANPELLGKKVFTNVRPTNVPERQTIVCMLHKDNEQRGYFDSIGLGGKGCRKSNLASEYEVQSHMEHKHPREWKTIEQAREKQEKADTQRLMLVQLEAMKALADNKGK